MPDVGGCLISRRHQPGQAAWAASGKSGSPISSPALQRTRELLYLMFKAGYVSLQDIPRDKDHAPSRTIYTWRANNDVAVGQMGGDIYKSALNARLFYEHHFEANKQVSPDLHVTHGHARANAWPPCQCTLKSPGPRGIVLAATAG